MMMNGPENLSSCNFSRVYSELVNITVITAGKTLKVKMKMTALISFEISPKNMLLNEINLMKMRFFYVVSSSESQYFLILH